MASIIFLIGTPFSGKTEYAKKHCELFEHYVRISRTDLYQINLKNNINKNLDVLNEATNLMFSTLISYLLSKGKSIIIDDNNYCIETILYVKKVFTYNNNTVSVHTMPFTPCVVKLKNTVAKKSGKPYYELQELETHFTKFEKLQKNLHKNKLINIIKTN